MPSKLLQINANPQKYNYKLKIFIFFFFFIASSFCADENVPIILGWNNFFGQGNIIHTIAPKEQVEKCRRRCLYSEDQKDVSRASVLVFHAKGFTPSPLKERRAEQLFVYFDLESPYTTQGEQYPSPDFFNLTMSYLAQSRTNLHAPYGAVHPVNFSSQEDLEDMWTPEEVLERVKLKNKLVLQVVSNCAPASGRNLYTEELERHLNVSVFGRCSHRECDNQCYWKQMEEHFFYLAFENAACRNYVTEKFWQPFRHLTVPIVLSREAMQGLPIPPDSFIAADDFSSVGELANHLVALRQDEKRYLSFFNWTRFHRRESEINPPTRAICQLCELAHQRLAPGSRVIPDIYKLWHEEGNCQLEYAKKFIRPREELGEEKEAKIGPKKEEGVFWANVQMFGLILLLILFFCWTLFIRKFRRFLVYFPCRLWHFFLSNGAKKATFIV